jgi:hypothetical protein
MDNSSISVIQILDTYRRKPVSGLHFPTRSFVIPSSINERDSSSMTFYITVFARSVATKQSPLTRNFLPHYGTFTDPVVALLDAALYVHAVLLRLVTVNVKVVPRGGYCLLTDLKVTCPNASVDRVVGE